MDNSSFKPLAVSKSTFLGLIWAFPALSLLFLAFRGYVRLRVFRRFFFDDGFLLLAWILLITNAGIWQNTVDDLYLIYGVTIGAVQPPADLLDILTEYSQRTVAISVLNVFSLWSIKTSFLLFFHQLGNNVKGQRIIWWTAAVACFIGFAISIGVQNYKCVMGSAAEALVMAVPIKLLWTAQISARLKLSLVVLFSLTIFTMIIAIIKVTLSLRNRREDDSWIYVWTGIEPAVGLIIASLVSYRALVNKDRKRSRYTPQTTLHSDQKGLQYNASGAPSSHGNESQVRAGQSSSNSSLGEEVVPLDVIKVRKDFDVVPASELGYHHDEQHKEGNRS
ncbi:MAG: hypothetical protein Q9228_003704 [Teloschistes exilis]